MMRLLAIVTAALVAACATGGESAPSAPKPILLLAPIGTADVPERIRSRSAGVEKALASYLSKRGFRVERLSSEEAEAVRSDGSARAGGYEALVAPRIVQKSIEATRRTNWDGIHLSPPARRIPDQFESSYRGGQSIRVLSVEVEIRSPEGDVLYEGAGGLDHLEEFRYSPRTGVERIEYSKTLSSSSRIRRGVSAALGPYFSVTEP